MVPFTMLPYEQPKIVVYIKSRGVTIQIKRSLVLLSHDALVVQPSTKKLEFLIVSGISKMALSKLGS